MSSSHFQIVFLGTGVSTAIPSIRHILDMDLTKCSVCLDAMDVPGSKNKRNNVSIAIIFENELKVRKCILIDAGKTLRDTCLSTFVKYSIKEVNAILLTHGHADAILGIDDLRDLQNSKTVAVPDKKDPSKEITGFKILSGPMNLYLTQETMNTVSNAFPYLTTCQPCYLDEKNNVLERRIALLKYNIIQDFDTMEIEQMSIRSFPVLHGGDYVSLGFSIGKEGEFVYISDVKLIPEETWKYLKSIPRIRYLVIDVLNWTGIFSHMGCDEAIEVVNELQPEMVYFTGMSCGMGLHDEIEHKLHAELGHQNCFLAYDGLCVSGLAMK
jgi:phosphoribosyl 1,2-cyclic phosphodiesterase